MAAPNPATDLRSMRKRLALTQSQLAEILETHQETISRQERGKYPIRRERLWAMERLCDNPELLTRFSDGDGR